MKKENTRKAETLICEMPQLGKGGRDDTYTVLKENMGKFKESLHATNHDTHSWSVG